MTITEPCLIDGMSDAEYHADPVEGGSLSHSGAKTLLASCAAKFAYEREHGRAPKREFDFGHAAHSKLLGRGAELVPIDARSYNTKAAQQSRDAAYEAGKTPVLVGQLATVDEMVSKVRQHPIAAPLLADGTPEVSLFWIDDQTSIWRRARFDWLPNPRRGRRILVDYKTTDSADNDACARSIYNYGYHGQADWYLTGAAALGLGEDAAFLFIFQEKTAPYLVNVVGCDETMLAHGRARNDKAIGIYAKCAANDHWPGYGEDEITYVSLPPWVERRFLEGQL